MKKVQKELEENWRNDKKADFIKMELDQNYIDKERSVISLKRITKI